MKQDVGNQAAGLITDALSWRMGQEAEETGDDLEGEPVTIPIIPARKVIKLDMQGTKRFD